MGATAPQLVARALSSHALSRPSPIRGSRPRGSRFGSLEPSRRDRRRLVRLHLGEEGVRHAVATVRPGHQVLVADAGGEDVVAEKPKPAPIRPVPRCSRIRAGHLNTSSSGGFGDELPRFGRRVGQGLANLFDHLLDGGGWGRKKGGQTDGQDEVDQGTGQTDTLGTDSEEPVRHSQIDAGHDAESGSEQEDPQSLRRLDEWSSQRAG